MSLTRAAAHPDQSVRVAWVADAPALGRVQARAWRSDFDGLLPREALDELDPEALAATWADALRRPPTAQHRVLVALDRNTVVGFAATGPAEDPDAHPGRDAEMTLLVIDPDHQRQGHGSRLLAAVVDTARADGFSRLTTWVLAQDDAVRSLLISAGWAPDGAHREMVTEQTSDDEDVPVARQVRLHTSVEMP